MITQSPVDLTEAEIQLLITLIELAQPKETPNNNHYRFYPQTIPEAASYFKGYLQDWGSAYKSLHARGWIQSTGNDYSLTSAGVAIARQIRDDRPPIYYWYQEFYSQATNSEAYARFCERLYGRYLCQANFSDMQQLEKLVEVTRLSNSQRVLDLGCGIGMIAEYLSDLSGASFLGIDYSPLAVYQALERTQAKRDRLDFNIANLDSLNYPAESFDTIISIDTLYMPNDLLATLRRLFSLLRSGGLLVVFYSQILFDPHADRQMLLPGKNPLGLALTTLGLTYETWDFSEQTYQHLQRKHHIGLDMESAFAREGNQGLYDYIVAESESSQALYDPLHSNHSRYLYRVLKP